MAHLHLLSTLWAAGHQLWRGRDLVREAVTAGLIPAQQTPQHEPPQMDPLASQPWERVAGHRTGFADDRNASQCLHEKSDQRAWALRMKGRRAYMRSQAKIVGSSRYSLPLMLFRLLAMVVT